MTVFWQRRAKMSWANLIYYNSFFRKGGKMFWGSGTVFLLYRGAMWTRMACVTPPLGAESLSVGLQNPSIFSYWNYFQNLKPSNSLAQFFSTSHFPKLFKDHQKWKQKDCYSDAIVDTSASFWETITDFGYWLTWGLLCGLGKSSDCHSGKDGTGWHYWWADVAQKPRKWAWCPPLSLYDLLVSPSLPTFSQPPLSHGLAIPHNTGVQGICSQIWGQTREQVACEVWGYNSRGKTK